MTNIDFTKSEQYLLSIRLSADGFSFSIHHPENGEDIYFETYKVNTSYSMTANIKEMLVSTEAFKYSYKGINVLIDTFRFTAVPFDLFEDEHTEDLFLQNFPKTDNETILCNILGKSNIALLFGMDKHAHQLLNDHYPKARFFACVSPLIEHFTLKSQEEISNRKLYANFRKDRMEVFAFDKGKPVFINTFSCKQTADIVYYLLYIWQQLGFSQEKEQLCLTGNLSKKEEVLDELRKYLRKTDILPNKNNIPFDLQTLMTCE